MPGHWPYPKKHHSAGTLVRNGQKRLHVSDVCQEGKTLCGARIDAMQLTDEPWSRIGAEPEKACRGCLVGLAQIRADYRKAMYGN